MVIGTVSQIEVDQSLIGDAFCVGQRLEVVDGAAVDVDGDPVSYTHLPALSLNTISFSLRVMHFTLLILYSEPIRCKPHVVYI